MGDEQELSSLLSAGRSLVDTGQDVKTSHLLDVLNSRLTRYRSLVNNVLYDPGANIMGSRSLLEGVQLETALAALYVVKRVHRILEEDARVTVMSDAPVYAQGNDEQGTLRPDAFATVGTRDIATLRTLLGIVFKWGINPLLDCFDVMLLDESLHDGSTPASGVHKVVSSMTSDVLELIAPESESRTVITATVLNKHLSDVCRSSLSLGWLPKKFVSEDTPVVSSFRSTLIHLLKRLPTVQVMVALGAVLSEHPSSPSYIRKAGASLLSRQLLRVDGPRALCAAIFGEIPASDDDAPLEKLEQIARVLATVPTGLKAQEYYGIIIPRVLELLTDPSALIFKRAAAFAVSRLLLTAGSSHRFVNIMITSNLHAPFLHVSVASEDYTVSNIVGDAKIPIKPSMHFTPTASLDMLTVLVANTDPSPTLISSLLSPILPELYCLFANLERTKTTNPALREQVQNLLFTWGRIIDAEVGVDILWTIVEGEGSEWSVDFTGEIKRAELFKPAHTLPMLTPAELLRQHDRDEDPDKNVLGLRPDPVQLIRLLKSMNRDDISSEFFVKLLEAYHSSKSTSGADPIRVLTYLQLVIEMHKQMMGGTTTNILTKPGHILSFIKNALESTVQDLSALKGDRVQDERHGLKLEDLRIVPVEELSVEDDDSDDEDDRNGISAPDNEMAETSIDLLLSILEVNDRLSPHTTPILDDISSLLQQFVDDLSHPLRSLALEAKLVLTTRLASTSTPREKTNDPYREEALKTYQKALKLLQDPILPVRAHGLLLLRQLVSSEIGVSKEPPLDAALVPSILSIFLQSIQDDDSYIFLNAVQGLSAMVDSFGKDVLKSLVRIYTEGSSGAGNFSDGENDLNTRLRVGEALGQVIRRYGEALAIYADFLVPPILPIIGSSHVPVALRTSALSLLAECARTSTLALLPYLTDLIEAMIDLLQTERTPIPLSTIRSLQATEDKSQPEQMSASMDDKPTTTNSKPPLRRAAIHLLMLIVHNKSTTNADFGLQIDHTTMTRMNNILGYITSTDPDGVVRVMSREVLDQLKDINDSVSGLIAVLDE